MINSSQPHPTTHTTPTTPVCNAAETSSSRIGWLKNEKILLLTLLALIIVTWLPRLEGPIDLRWDGGAYYVLGTSLAEGKGYKLLNEPGEIDAVQYPPLLPAIIAGHQLMLGTNDPTVIGRWLRLSAFILFIAYIFTIYRFLKIYLPVIYALPGAIICLFHLYFNFLSDLCFPETLFGLTTLLFFLYHLKSRSRGSQPAAYLFAVASYAVRTVGITVLAAWVAEGLVKREFKKAALRLVLILIPVLCWQFYISSIESSYEYNHPTYAYQRAPYMFYNVTYARNIALRDPFAPEKGPLTIEGTARRFVHNTMRIPVKLAEMVSAKRVYWELGWTPWSESPTFNFIMWLLILAVLSVLSCFVLGGLGLLLIRREWIIPLYVVMYITSICLTPFPGQFHRYLMPLVPFLVLSLLLFLLAAKDESHRILPPRWVGIGKRLMVPTLCAIFVVQIVCITLIYTQEHRRAVYRDRNNQVLSQRLFFYNQHQQAFDDGVDWLRQQAQPDDVIASSMPHWIYLRTGMKTVMPPLEIDVGKAQQLLDSVPVSYLILDRGAIDLQPYVLPLVQRYPERWKKVYKATDGDLTIYQRVSH